MISNTRIRGTGVLLTKLVKLAWIILIRSEIIGNCPLNLVYSKETFHNFGILAGTCSTLQKWEVLARRQWLSPEMETGNGNLTLCYTIFCYKQSTQYSCVTLSRDRFAKSIPLVLQDQLVMWGVNFFVAWLLRVVPLLSPWLTGPWVKPLFQGVQLGRI